ncbi:hypothetical protein [Pectinatus frisingensis]|uniref:hypothetical protein n=1 Tax=Pectinatus frisingensis TaxID=865 RepID=UPI0018C5EE85|nr:hypothetical protein [Pectinatus frisingensis]
MQKIKYKLTAQSSLIVSPRMNTALYKELDEFSLKQLTTNDNYLDKDKLNIIYPFYQYGEYTKYAPERAKYYLPGSSIKGALCQKRSSDSGNIMVDDIKVSNDDVVLRNLYKAQYVNDEQKADFAAFFPNVGVEMIKARATLTGDIYVKDKNYAISLIKSANDSAKKKLEQMLVYLDRLKGQKEHFLLHLNCAKFKITAIKDSDDIFLVGGYKGLLNSIEIEKAQQEINSAIFLDQETGLPHGIVKIKLI